MNMSSTIKNSTKIKRKNNIEEKSFAKTWNFWKSRDKETLDARLESTNSQIELENKCQVKTFFYSGNGLKTKDDQITSEKESVPPS